MAFYTEWHLKRYRPHKVKNGRILTVLQTPQTLSLFGSHISPYSPAQGAPGSLNRPNITPEFAIINTNT